MTLEGMRVGYVPYSADLSAPGDRRRFPYYARRRGLHFEIACPGRRYDVVVLSSRADITAWAAEPAGTRIVYELLDSYLAPVAHDLKGLLRGPAKFLTGEIHRPTTNYRRAIEAMCRRADAVVCTTDEQRRTLLELCPNVHIILDIHSEVGSSVKSDYTIGDTLNLVWEGLPYTIEPFRLLAPVLRDMARERPVALHLVTDLKYPRYAGRFVVRDTARMVRSIFEPAYLYEWNKETVGAIVTACDLAVIPIRLDDPFAAGKPENKLLLLWRLGMPTLASATPAYLRAMAACGLDMACASEEEWRVKLAAYAADGDLRRQAGLAGQAFVEKHHVEESTLRLWDRLVETVV